MEHFREAIEIDPTWPAGFVGLPDAYNVLGYFGALAPVDCFPKAKAAALAALQLDEGLARAHAAPAIWTSSGEWRSRNPFRPPIPTNLSPPTGR